MQEGAVLANQSKLGRCGAGVDTEEAVSFVVGKRRLRYGMFFMSFGKFIIFVFVSEKRIKTRNLKLHLDSLFKARLHVGKGNRFGTLRGHCRTDGGEQMRMVGSINVLVREL